MGAASRCGPGVLLPVGVKGDADVRREQRIEALQGPIRVLEILTR